MKMSEVLNDYRKLKVDRDLKLGSGAPLSYVNRQLDSQNEVLCCVEIPWLLLHLWRDVL